MNIFRNEVIKMNRKAAKKRELAKRGFVVRRIVDTPLGPRVGSPLTPNIDAAYVRVRKARKARKIQQMLDELESDKN